ncbi:MAG: hypothetical protein RXQ56_02205 [Thermoproteus sp.]
MSSGNGVDAGAVRRPPGPADPVERLLKEWPELGVFGADWLRTWAPRAGRQIARIARVLRRYPWMAELIGQGPVGLVNPYSVEAYVARDGSEACISLFGGWAYCSADGGVTVRRLELEFSRLEPHEGGVGEVYRPKRRSIFAKAKEYIRIL